MQFFRKDNQRQTIVNQSRGVVFYAPWCIN